MGFTLELKNAPGFWPLWYSVKWSGSYGLVTSGWLDIGEIWDCPYGAYGATDLTILVVDAGWDYTHQKSDLGPVNDGEAYIYDCNTELLTEVETEWFEVYSSTLELDVSVVAHWEEVWSGSLQLGVSVIAHWYEVYSGSLQLDIEGNGNGNGEEPEKAFPWIPVALIGGGAAVAIAAATAKPKKAKA